MKGDKYAKIFTKIPVSAIFHNNYYSRYSEKCFTKTLEGIVWCHVGVHPDDYQHDGPKPTETSVTVFCYESVIHLLRTLKISTVILFSSTMTVPISKSPKMSPFF